MYIWEHFKRTMKNERGFWSALAGMLPSVLGAAGAGMSMFGNNKNKGSPGGWAVQQMPTWSWNEGVRKTAADYASQGLQNMQQGRFAPWYENAMPAMRESMSRGNRQAYYGVPGERTGAMNAGMEAGALTGLGPRGANANVLKLGRSYADRESQIDEYLQKMGVDVNLQSQGTYLNSINQAPQGPPSQVVGPWPGSQGYQQGTDWGGLMQNLGGVASGINGMMNQGGGDSGYFRALGQNQDTSPGLQNPYQGYSPANSGGFDMGTAFNNYDNQMTGITSPAWSSSGKSYPDFNFSSTPAPTPAPSRGQYFLQSPDWYSPVNRSPA